MSKELELTDRQVERIDEIHNAAYEFLTVLTGDPNLEWDMEHIGELVDCAAEDMASNGYKIYYPAIETDLDGTQKRVDYYEPSVTPNGVMVEGGYWDESRFGKLEGKIPEEFHQYEAKITSQKDGKVSIWARSEEEAMKIPEDFTSKDMAYILWSHAGLTVDMTGQDGPGRTVMLLLKDRDGLNETIRPMTIYTALPKDEIIPAIKAAAQEFLNTPEGRKVWEDNCGNFNYGDFDLNVPNGICLHHGFYRNAKAVPTIMEDDFDVTLGELDYE